MTPWPHQLRGVQAVLRAWLRGMRRLVLTSPTGGGKTRMEQMLALDLLSRGRRVDLFTNRKILLEQLSQSLDGANIPHGIRASGYAHDPEHRLQVVSVQTDHARRARTLLNPGDVAIVDEGHLFNNPSSKAILERYRAYVLVTATPLGLADMADELIVAGTPSELRQCGALVPAIHVGPTEPDLKQMKALREGQDLSENQQRKAMPPKLLWGSVLRWYHKTNPERRPSILFAPGVPESLWFARTLSENGIRSAHIDGEDVWLDGRLIPSSRQAREDVIGGSKDGSIQVLCNRFVLREGVDLPWLYHGIFATVFGSLQSYLQAGGRLLRAHPGLDSVVIQDHGGHWWRHGSLNSDREWGLDLTNESAYGMRADRLREKREREPWRCPSCATILMARRCAFCGYEGQKRCRAVLQADGQLREMVGEVFKPRRITKRKDGPKLWERMYWRSKTEKGRRTFKAAAALFAMENDYGWPDPTWPFMPTNPMDWYRDVSIVPMDRLTHAGSVDTPVSTEGGVA